MYFGAVRSVVLFGFKHWEFYEDKSNTKQYFLHGQWRSLFWSHIMFWEGLVKVDLCSEIVILLGV